MPNPISIDPDTRPSWDWQAMHEDPARLCPRGWPVVDDDGEGQRYAWSLPGLSLAAPSVLETRSVGEAARQLIEVGRSSKAFAPSRRRLALVLPELDPAGGPKAVAGCWPSGGVARRIAVTVTLDRAESVLGLSRSRGSP